MARVRSEDDDEGHHPLGVIVISGTIENEAAAQGPTINYRLSKSPSALLVSFYRILPARAKSPSQSALSYRPIESTYD